MLCPKTIIQNHVLLPIGKCRFVGWVRQIPCQNLNFVSRVGTFSCLENLTISVRNAFKKKGGQPYKFGSHITGSVVAINHYTEPLVVANRKMPIFLGGLGQFLVKM